MEALTLDRAPSVRVRGGNQDPAEFARFLALVKSLNVRRYLEVGCRNGDTFDAVMRVVGSGGYGVAVDLPENSSARNNLSETVAELNRDGLVEADLLFGNSQSGMIVDQVRDRAPFDLILIDADHRYQGVRRDFALYRDMGRVLVLHDVSAPRGHQSDGYENGVGVFWSEIKSDFRHEELVTPGSRMGFGVLYNDARATVEIKREQPIAATGTPPIYIACPAWGKYYVDLACRFTIPAVLASLKDSPFADATFLIHTDDQDSFRRAIGNHKIEFLKLLPMGRPPNNGAMPRLPDNYWVAFKQAHKDAINATPVGGVVTLLNSDVVVSRECFSFVADEIAKGAKVVASVGIRTQIEDNDGPPIGAGADELFKWIWGHRHHITEECIWDHGRSHHPTILFFQDGNDVEMRCFHLTPMFIRKERDLQFKGTIDDDLLMQFRDNEICYIAGGDVAFAEISPNWKTHPFGRPLTVEHVLEFWRRRAMRPHYLRNFKQRMRVLGNPTKDHPAVKAIIAGLSR